MIAVAPLAGSPVAVLGAVIAESEASGLDFVRRLAEEWSTGANRFDAPVEVLCIARADDVVAGVAGLNIDRCVTEPRVGRVRHPYVLAAHRRTGVGRQLVARIIEAARSHFDRVRLRTTHPTAARVYEGLGFERVRGVPRCTHILALEGLPPHE